MKAAVCSRNGRKPSRLIAYASVLGRAAWCSGSSAAMIRASGIAHPLSSSTNSSVGTVKGSATPACSCVLVKEACVRVQPRVHLRLGGRLAQRGQASVQRRIECRERVRQRERVGAVLRHDRDPHRADRLHAEDPKLDRAPRARVEDPVLCPVLLHDGRRESMARLKGEAGLDPLDEGDFKGCRGSRHGQRRLS